MSYMGSKLPFAAQGINVDRHLALGHWSQISEVGLSFKTWDLMRMWLF